MPDRYTIVLALPTPRLWPNFHPWSRKGALAKMRETKRYRKNAANLTLEALCRAKPRWKRATEQATFYFVDRRWPDKDNCLGAIKNGLDGMVDAGLLADDRDLTHLPVIRRVDREHPRVVVEVRRDTS